MRRGDRAVVRSPAEILRTLDDDGTLDGLPFMPEMIRYCGQALQVAFRVQKTCVDGYLDTFRAFPDDDVVFLEELRCDGADHDGCARACRLFWKDAWLIPEDEAGDPSVRAAGNATAARALRARLKTREGEQRYFCQSSRLLHATRPVYRGERLLKIAEDIRYGNRTPSGAARQLLAALNTKLRGELYGKAPAGPNTRTPRESLGLEVGEWVEVKPYEEIVATLDGGGRNRGLVFTEEMRHFCGRRYRVERILDRMILEETGEMRELSDTVILEGVRCQCLFAIGGCHRAETSYWREIWLRRVERR